jgi:HPt (histidine-containing phosphotransfer) domain-containing protein
MTFLIIAAVAVLGVGLAVALIKGGGRASGRAGGRVGPGASLITRSIDPFTVQEPWRQYVQSAQSAQRKLAEVIAQRAEGPTKDRLMDTSRQIDDVVARIGEAAEEGHALNKLSRLSELPSLEQRSRQAELDLAAAPVDRQAALESSLASLRSSVEVGRRLVDQRDQASDRLRELDARLDELVVRAIEVSSSSVAADAADTLRVDLESLVVDLEGLRQGLAETRATATA